MRVERPRPRIAVRLLGSALLALGLGLAHGAIADEERAAPSSGPHRVFEHELFFSEAGRAVRHLVFTPSSYPAASASNPPGERGPAGPWPLLVGLHGTAGEPEQVLGFQRLLELAERFGFLVVCPHSSGRGELHHRYVLRVVEDVEERYAVDPGAIFLMGFSRGGGGVWELGARFPDRWAGLAPISPATPTRAPRLEGLRHLPVIVVQGDRDRAVSVPTTRRWVRQMEELGMTHQFLELPGVGHDLSRVNFLPAVFRFFEAQRRHGPPQARSFRAPR
ncbi:MAG: hypothetical protein AAF725_14610 [Acidobacteriota bacterium]